MELDHFSLTLPREDHGAISLQEGIVRSVNQSSQLLVVEVPADAIERTALAGQVGIEAGASVVVQTTDRTYEGYVEVVAENVAGRIYWCGAC